MPVEIGAKATILPSGDVLLFAKPGFLIPHALHTAWVDTYRRHISLGPKEVGEEELLENIDRIFEYLDQHGQEEAIALRNSVIDEYESILSKLSSAVGRSNLRLVRQNPFKVAMVDQWIEDAKYLDNQVEDKFPTVRFDKRAQESAAWPRDLFTRIGNLVFVSPNFLPNFKETKEYKISPLAIGGQVIQSRDAIVLSEEFLSPIVRADIRTLERKGFKIAYVPSVRPEMQPEDKREFVDAHIDGHCNLVTGKDDKLYFLFAGSYYRQDPTTSRSIELAAYRIGATPIEVDDTRLSHLAFNFLELPNNSYVYAPSGMFVNGQYQASWLDHALDQIVGVDRLVMTRQLRQIPHLTKGSIRCMTNIVPGRFLQYLNRN